MNSAYKLDINGTARATKVVVNTTGADFVFDSSYHLPLLQDVEKYISANHHLQGIASAIEMGKQGVDLGDEETRLLQKVEELTLYMIDQNNQLSEQKKQVDLQQKEMVGLKEENKKLEEQNRQLLAQQERIDRLEKLIGEKTESKK